MNLFDFKDRNVIVNPEALLVPEFKALWSRDKTKEKLRATRELSYIYFISDYRSPYRTSLTPNSLASTVSSDFMKDPNFKPDDLIKSAMTKYNLLQRTPTMALLASSITTVHKLTDYLEGVDLAERDQNNKPIYKPTDVTNALKSIGGIVESLNMVRESIEKEITKATSIRGQRRKGNREDPGHRT
jgi:hypothetical protein